MNEPAVLVTGAMGNLGREVTRLLLERDRTVIALDVGTKGTRAAADRLRPASGQPGTLIPAFVDLVDAAQVATVVVDHRPATIVHLAAILAPACYRSPQFARRVNVEGTRNLVGAATHLDEPPMFVEASSVSVYGPRNPHRHTGRLTADTPVNPADCYGEDKVEAERVVAMSGLPHAILRIGGVMSPEMLSHANSDHLVLMRATPRDNRLHMVDARDVALAFANAVELGAAIDGKCLLIAGNESFESWQREIEDDCMQALGIGRLGPTTGLPGDPDDDGGWGLTDWLDTTEAQELLAFQVHDWQDTLDWIAQEQGPKRVLVRAVSPAIRAGIRLLLAVQRRREKRGPFADPWQLIRSTYGDQALARDRAR